MRAQIYITFIMVGIIVWTVIAMAIDMQRMMLNPMCVSLLIISTSMQCFLRDCGLSRVPQRSHREAHQDDHGTTLAKEGA